MLVLFSLYFIYDGYLTIYILFLYIASTDTLPSQAVCSRCTSGFPGPASPTDLTTARSTRWTWPAGVSWPSASIARTHPLPGAVRDSTTRRPMSSVPKIGPRSPPSAPYGMTRIAPAWGSLSPASPRVQMPRILRGITIRECNGPALHSCVLRMHSSSSSAHA